MPPTVTTREVEVLVWCPLSRCFDREKLFAHLNTWAGRSRVNVGVTSY